MLAAIGCNVAWGVIDAVLVVMSSRYARRRRGRLMRVIHAARDESSALAVIRDEFESGVEATTRPGGPRAALPQHPRALRARAADVDGLRGATTG